jgi:hypothetical protein
MVSAPPVCYTDPSAFEEGRARCSIGLSLEEGQTILDRYPEEAILRIVVSCYHGPKSAWGQRVEVRKFGSEWAPLSVTRVWVA